MEDIPRNEEDFSRNMEGLSRNTEDLSRNTEDLPNNMEDLFQKHGGPSQNKDVNRPMGTMDESKNMEDSFKTWRKPVIHGR